MLGRGPISSTPISGDAGAPAFTANLRLRSRSESGPYIAATDESRWHRARDVSGATISVQDFSEGD